MADRAAARKAARVARARAATRRADANVVTGAWAEIALVLVCAELFVFVLAFDLSLHDVFDMAKAVFSHAIGWVLLATLVVLGLSRTVRIPLSPLFIAFYVLVAAEVASTVTATDPYVALYGEVGRYLGLTTHAVLALLAVAIAVTLDYPRRAAWLAWALAAVAVISGIYAVVQFAGLDPVRWADLDPRSRPFGTFGNPDFYGQFLAVVVVACAAFLAFEIGRQRVAILAGVAALGVFTLALMVITQTRGALLGVAAGAFVLAVLWLRRSGLSRAALLRFGAAAGAFAVAGLVIMFATPIGGRVLDIARGVGIRDRQLIYDSAIRMFADRPIFGVGFENFAVVYPRYQQAEWFTLAGTNSTNTSAHNWILHTAATMGIVGLAATFAILAAFAVVAWRRARDEDATPVLVAAVAAASFYGSGIVLPGAQSIQWIPWACLGVALAGEVGHARSVAIPRVRLPSLALAAIAIVLAGLALFEFGTLTANQLAKTAEMDLSSDPKSAVDAAKAALASDSGRAVYWNDLGRALERTNDNRGARNAYLEATRRSPYTPAFWWNLSRIQAVFAQSGEAGAKDATYDAMRRAVAASPENPETFDRNAHLEFNLGDYPGAVDSERQAIRFGPRTEMYYSFGASAAEKNNDGGTAIDLLQEGVAATDSNNLRYALAKVLVTASRVTEARAVLAELLRKDPTNGPAMELLKQIGSG